MYLVPSDVYIEAKALRLSESCSVYAIAGRFEDEYQLNCGGLRSRYSSEGVTSRIF